MTPDTSPHMPPVTPELSIAEFAEVVRNEGAALVESKLPSELFDKDWQTATPSDSDNPFANRGAIGFAIPEPGSGIPYSPEPLAASVQFLNSYSSMRTKGKNQLIMSAPVDPDNPHNKNILHRFQGAFRQIVVSLELPQEGFTTRRSGPDSTLPAKFKFFLPDEQAQLIFTRLKTEPEAVPLLLQELWPGTKRVTLNPKDMLVFELSKNPNNQAEAAEVFATM